MKNLLRIGMTALLLAATVAAAYPKNSAMLTGDGTEPIPACYPVDPKCPPPLPPPQYPLPPLPKLPPSSGTSLR